MRTTRFPAFLGTIALTVPDWNDADCEHIVDYEGYYEYVRPDCLVIIDYASQIANY